MKRSRGFILAIDGTAGSGKSTTARLCAERLGFRHLDTGAMYRAFTLKVMRTDTDILRGADEGRSEKPEARVQKSKGRSQKPEAKAAGTNVGDRKSLAGLLRRTSVSVDWKPGRMRVLLDGRDVSEAIREPEVSGHVSEVSAIPAVRRQMVAEQRRVAAEQMVVCEGRDIGSVVFPDANLKVFMECSPAERARRRWIELAESGTRVSLKSVLTNLLRRDRIDSSREASPLRRMPDAILVDTSDLTIQEQVGIICDLARRRIQAKGSRGRGFQGKGSRIRGFKDSSGESGC